MATIRITDFPNELYERLEHTAAANRRSINDELIAILADSLRGRAITPAEWLISARQIRELTAETPITDEEMTQIKKSGRP